LAKADDRTFYLSIIDDIARKFEIANEFSKINGLNSFPAEELFDLVIDSVKRWLISEDGSIWLGTLGYERAGGISEDGTYKTETCSLCKSLVAPHELTSCEKCGTLVCEKCLNIVDEVYHVKWCTKCI
jgi:hypothetical protein